MKKKLIKRLIIGFFIGAIIGNVISILSRLPDGEFAFISEKLEDSIGLTFGIILNSFLSGLIGAAGFGGSVFYDIEKWSIIKATLSHYVCCIICFTLAFFILYWGDFATYLIMFIIETIIFLLIWIIIYQIWKKSVRELNENLEKYQKEQENEKSE